jgi:hypothetical protein
MTRLEIFVDRLLAQRACLEAAAGMIAAVPGPILELGLGNGRTYDHLREHLPGRDIWVFERRVAAHPASMPPADRLILGDVRATLPGALARIGAPAALVHVDLGGHSAAGNGDLALHVAPLIAPLLAEGGLVVSMERLAFHSLREIALPDARARGRCFLYRRGDA